MEGHSTNCTRDYLCSGMFFWLKLKKYYPSMLLYRDYTHQERNYQITPQALTLLELDFSLI